ncbi:MAG: PAS domain-containing protein [Nitrospirota bacterium]
MNDQGKIKEQLIAILRELREELALLKALSSDKFQIVGALRDFKGIYDNFYKSNPHPMWIYDLETLVFLDVNNAAIKHYGYSQEEFLSMTIKDIRPPEDIPALLENVSKVTEGLDIAGTWRHIKKNGDLIYVEIISHTMALAGRRTEIVLAVDITDRKRSEEALKETEQKLRNIIEHSNELYYMHDIEHTLNYVSPQSLQILGYTPEEMMVQWTRLITDNLINRNGIEVTEKALKTGERQRPYFLELYKKDKRKVMLEIDESPMKDNKGNVIGIVGAARDVTERKKIEIELQNSEERYRSTVDFLDDALHVADENLNILLINKKLLEWNGRFGLDTDVIGKNIFNLYPFLSSNVQEEYKSVFKTGRPTRTVESTFFNGGEVITETKKIPIFEENKVIKVITIMRDITERKKVEKELKQRMKELQDFYDMAVGRELRMKELKEENNKLRKQLERYKRQ